MLNFERSAKGFMLTGRPCVFDIFVRPGKVALAGFTDDLSPEDINKVCTVRRSTGASGEAGGE